MPRSFGGKKCSFFSQSPAFLFFVPGKNVIHSFVEIFFVTNIQNQHDCTVWVCHTHTHINQRNIWFINNWKIEAVMRKDRVNWNSLNSKPFMELIKEKKNALVAKINWGQMHMASISLLSLWISCPRLSTLFSTHQTFCNIFTVKHSY